MVLNPDRIAVLSWIRRCMPDELPVRHRDLACRPRRSTCAIDGIPLVGRKDFHSTESAPLARTNGFGACACLVT